MERPIKEVLQDEMKKRNIKTPELSKQIHIPKDRIYAWFRDGTTPKSEDQSKLEKWINNEEISNESGETENHVENEKGHRVDNLIRIADKNADAVVSSTKSVERLTAILERNSSSDLEKSVSNLQNYAGLVKVIRDIGIKVGYWKDEDTAEKELNRFVAFHKL